MQVSSLSGHFLARLYGDITLSTLYDSYTPGLIGWLPTVFPFRNVVFVEKNEVNHAKRWIFLPAQEITVRLRRCVNATHVWYEWQMLAPVQQAVQNENGYACRIAVRSVKIPENRRPTFRKTRAFRTRKIPNIFGCILLNLLRKNTI
jgi:protein arginine N-methyltransferase 5